MFGFAYDGSINGDWVSHYAVQLAGTHPDRTLRLVHVRDGRVESSRLAEKLDRLRLECESQGVRLETHLLEPKPWPGSVRRSSSGWTDCASRRPGRNDRVPSWTPSGPDPGMSTPAFLSAG
ncbi:universal stress protein [Allochromatium tepidum]|uniref:UspA domain-containing protein n=1 Tax=Allochromatium tepidum TaxID=553982 RepID=A0ABN6GGU1_9GAMM|nr:universal stress protein [Allochromatium tepidum]BCU07550.1 hypothetical protein Atep_22270 [Allochromatium tepidum]